MSPNFSNKKFPISIKLLSYSLATVMTMGLVVGISREVAGETQSVSSTEQSAQLAEAKRLNNQAVQLYEEGKYDKAIPLAKRALAIHEKLLGKEHPDLSTSLNNLALLYDSRGSYAEAESLYLRSLAIDEKVLGKEHPEVATILSNLAGVYHSQGNYTKWLLYCYVQLLFERKHWVKNIPI